MEGATRCNAEIAALNAAERPTSPSALGFADAPRTVESRSPIEYRPQLDIDVLRPARRVMNVEHTIRAAQLICALHRTVFARLVAGHVVVMRHLVALAAHVRMAGNAELALISGVGGKDAVLGIEHDHRLGVVLQIRHECVDIRRLRRLPRHRVDGRDGNDRS
jgi:hypothetical protein